MIATTPQRSTQFAAPSTARDFIASPRRPLRMSGKTRRHISSSVYYVPSKKLTSHKNTHVYPRNGARQQVGFISYTSSARHTGTCDHSMTTSSITSFEVKKEDDWIGLRIPAARKRRPGSVQRSALSFRRFDQRRSEESETLFRHVVVLHKP